MKIDENFLVEMGLEEMSAEQKPAFLEYVQEELELRIGQRIAEGLTEEQITEFEQIEDKELAKQWIEEHFPNYKEVMQEVFEGLKKQILANRKQLLA